MARKRTIYQTSIQRRGTGLPILELLVILFDILCSFIQIEAKNREINKLTKNLERLKNHLLDIQRDAEETILDLKKTY
jgi:hypothetical protein